MLSDEEKQAIEYWKYIRDTQIYDGYKGQVYAVTLLNLIEKQSKEIEELKEVKWYYEISRVPKDKIKARIEEVSNGTYDAKIVLQSLLEKE